MKRPTVRDVALAAGVSSATVSRVLNNAPTVDQGLSQRVLDAVERTGYVPNAVGRSLRRQDSTQIAVLIPDASNPYFVQVVAEVERFARQAGLSVVLCHTEDSVELEQRYVHSLLSRQIAGVIAAAADEAASDYSALQRSGVPVVVVDRRPTHGEYDLIATDNAELGRLAARHLAQSGHRQPVCLVGPQQLRPTELRRAGFCEQWQRQGVDEVPTWRGSLNFECGADLMDQVLASEAAVDCVYVANNRMAAGAFAALQQAGRLPGQDREYPIALLGTDDDLWTQLVHPAVSVVQQPIGATGRLAAQTLVERIGAPTESEGQDAVRTTLLQPSVIVRASTQG